MQQRVFMFIGLQLYFYYSTKVVFANNFLFLFFSNFSPFSLFVVSIMVNPYFPIFTNFQLRPLPAFSMVCLQRVHLCLIFGLSPVNFTYRYFFLIPLSPCMTWPFYSFVPDKCFKLIKIIYFIFNIIIIYISLYFFLYIILFNTIYFFNLY